MEAFYISKYKIHVLSIIIPSSHCGPELHPFLSILHQIRLPQVIKPSAGGLQGLIESHSVRISHLRVRFPGSITVIKPFGDGLYAPRRLIHMVGDITVGGRGVGGFKGQRSGG